MFRFTRNGRAVEPWREDAARPRRVQTGGLPAEIVRPAANPPPAAPANPAVGEAVATARLMLSCDMGLAEGARALHDQLSRLGEFDKGDFTGDFASIAMFLFEIEPYVTADQQADPLADARAHADRWLPTLLARHRVPVLAACQRVIEKFAA